MVEKLVTSAITLIATSALIAAGVRVVCALTSAMKHYAGAAASLGGLT